MNHIGLFSLVCSTLLLTSCFDRPTNAQQSKVFDVKQIKFDERTYPVVVLGGGIAGLTAANYVAQANIGCLIIEGSKPGGALAQSDSVRNWPGIVEATGAEIVRDLKKQVTVNGVGIAQERVLGVDFDQWPYVISLQKLNSHENRTIKALSCIIAMGAEPNYLDIPGEQKYWGKGVTNCAVCDGALYKGKRVAVVGGGDSAVVETAYLSGIAEHVTLYVRKDQFRANDKKKKDEVIARDNVTVQFNTEVKEVVGNDSKVTHLILNNNKNNEQTTIEMDGLFLGIGATPNTSLFKTYLELDKAGYLVVDHYQRTNIQGVFAAGDIADPHFKQAVTSAAQGCVAALKAQEFLDDCGYDAVVMGSLTRNFPIEDVSFTGDKTDLANDHYEIQKITSNEQFETIIQDNEHVIVDAFAQFCIPCEQMLPVLKQTAQDFSDNIKIVKIDLSNQGDDLDIATIVELVDGEEVTSAPTFLFIQDGKEVGRAVGLVDQNAFNGLVKKYFEL